MAPSIGAVVRRRHPSDWHRADMGIRSWLFCAAACVLVAVAGCGSGSRDATGRTQVTIPAYGVFPATTVGGGGGSQSTSCRSTARSFAEGSADLLAHFGSRAAYPADLNYVIVRSELASFRARRCDLQLLGRALERRLSPMQRSDLLADLPPGMGAVVRTALASASSS
jgi:hypothetical protein